MNVRKISHLEGIRISKNHIFMFTIKHCRTQQSHFGTNRTRISRSYVCRYEYIYISYTYTYKNKLHIHMHIHIDIHIHIHMHIHKQKHLHSQIQIYIYIYIHKKNAYIHTHI